MKWNLLLLFMIVILGCKHAQSERTISFWGSFFRKGDILQLSINGKEVRKMNIRKDYLFTIAKEKKLYDYHYVGNTTRINISINQNDTTFYIDNKTIKTIIIGRNIYGTIMIDYEFTNGTRTFTIE